MAGAASGACRPGTVLRSLAIGGGAAVSDLRLACDFRRYPFTAGRLPVYIGLRTVLKLPACVVRGQRLRDALLQLLARFRPHDERPDLFDRPVVAVVNNV